MTDIKLTVKVNDTDMSDDEIVGHCADLTVAIKRAGLKVKDIKETPFSWSGTFDNTYSYSKDQINEYLDMSNRKLFNIKIRELNK
nr:hypothetical protein 19 [bacterium]